VPRLAEKAERMTTSTEQIGCLDRELRFGEHAYPYVLRSGPGAWADLATRLAGLGADRWVLVADRGVPPGVRLAVRECLREAAPVTVAEVGGGERDKTLAAVDAHAAKAISSGATRRSVVVSLGGGLAGNIAGLLAALLFRGVRLVHVPTTALAAWDSTPSLKQAANSACGKNHLGTFHAPVLVWANADVLAELPGDELRSGLCEAVKNVVAICPDEAAALWSLLRPGAGYSADELAWVIDMSLRAKQSVMADDPYETGMGLACEYGHTAGHAIELLHGLGHGMAIGVGGLIAARAARMLGVCGTDVEEMHEDLLLRNGAPVTIPAGVPRDRWLDLLRRDNKRGYEPPLPGRIDMVLLEAPGRLHRPGGGKPITQVPEDILLRAVRETEQS
jgi:3-dehydroquinate synthetase